MGQYFDLHNVQNTQKVLIATLFLEPDQFVWYQWLCFHKQIVTWSMFMDEMITHYEDTKSNTFFSQLINLKQKVSMVEHIEDFQKMNIRVNDISKEHRVDVFIGTLKDNIQHEVSFGNLIHWGRHSGWREKMKEKLWQQGSLPLTTIKMEVLLLLAFHNLQG